MADRVQYNVGVTVYRCLYTTKMNSCVTVSDIAGRQRLRPAQHNVAGLTPTAEHSAVEHSLQLKSPSENRCDRPSPSSLVINTFHHSIYRSTIPSIDCRPSLVSMMMLMMMMMKLPILPCAEKLPHQKHEITPTKTVITENGPISRGSHSEVSMVRDLWGKRFTKKVSFEFRVKE